MPLSLPERKTGAALVGALFLVSGMAGLIYELVWMRRLVLIFGNTLLATSTVLSAYMAGLAGGSYVVGKWIDAKRRPLLRWYAVLEAAIGFFALAFPLLLDLAGMGYQLLYRNLSDNLALLTVVRFLVCFVVILIPTFMMGGTLPILVKHLTDGGAALGNRLGLLYALNTIGAVAGTVVCGFLLLRFFGMDVASHTAVAMNLSVAAVAWGLSRTPLPRAHAREHAATEVAASSPPRPLDPRLLLVLAAIGISGFCSLAYQVLWTRMLSLFFRNNVYSFTTLLATFLLGIALGSFVYYRFLSRRFGAAWLLAALEIAIGVIGFATPYLFTTLPSGLFLSPDPLKIFIKASALMLLPTILIGITLPLATEICREGRAREGRSVGRVYAINTIGAVFGSFTAGFILIPLLGIQRAVVFVAGANLLAGLLVLVTLAGARLRLIGAGALAVSFAIAVALLPSNLFLRFHQTQSPDADVMTYKEGTIANVIVYDFWKEGYQDLYLNGVEEASSRVWHVQLFKMLGMLAPLLHPEPDNALMVAFGAGMSAGAAAQVVERLDCVDLNPDIQEVGRAFARENLDVLNNPRVHLIVNDGRNQLFLTPERYSVIISDATHPMSFDSWTLYSREFYELVKERLKDGGIFAQWLPVPTTDDALKLLLNTFKKVFPHTSFWMIHGSSQCMMLATPERLNIDYRAFRDRLTPLLESSGLTDFGVPNADKLLSFFFAGEDAIDRYLAGYEKVSTDDLPYAQFYGPLNQQGIQTSLDFLPFQETIEPYLTNLGPDEARLHEVFARYRTIGRALNIGFLQSSQLEYDKALLLAEGTDLQADENVKSALAYDTKRREYFQRRVAEHPGDHNARNSLGYVFLGEKEHDAALREFSKAIELKPDFVTAATNLARTYTRAGKYDLAVEQWLALRDMNPTPQTLEEAENQLEAVRSLRRLSYQPREPALYHELGALYVRQGRPVDAARILRKAVALAPDDVTSYKLLAGAYEALGLPDEARAADAKAYDLAPDDPQLGEKIASVAPTGDDGDTERQGEAPAAEPVPSPADALFQKAVKEWNRRDFDGKVTPVTLLRTVSMLEEVLRRDPKYMQAYVAAATVLEALGRHEEAAAVVGRGLMVIPGYEPAEDQKRRLDLLVALQKHAYKPEEREHIFDEIARLYWKSGELEMSIRYLEKALELAPRNSAFWANLAACYTQTGQLEKGLAALKQALALDPGSADLEQRAGVLAAMLESQGG